MNETNDNPILTANQNKLLALCLNRRRNVSEIAHLLNVTPASVSIMIKDLEESGKIQVDRLGIGKPTWVRTKEGNKTMEYYLLLLQEIKRRGEVSKEELMSMLPWSAKNPDYDKMQAPLSLLWTNYVEEKIRLTPEGEEFLKKQKKDNDDKDTKN